MDDAYSPIPELNLLKALQDRLGFEGYAEGFGLTDFGDTRWLALAWSRDPEFLSRLIPFAQANGSGAFYALWRIDGRSGLATLPVVVFGEAGGQHVVARDLSELLQLLGCDCEVSVDFDAASFCRRNEQKDSDGRAEYVAWLSEHLGLRPAHQPAWVIAEAQAALGESFSSWVEPFLR